MIDKVIQIGNGDEYYILDAFRKEGRIFAFAVKADTDQDVLFNALSIFEIKNTGDNFTIVDLEPEEMKKVSNVFAQRLRGSKGIEL